MSMKEEDTRIWSTRKGVKIPVEEMSTTHIINSINKIKSSGGWRIEWLPILEAELERRNMFVGTPESDNKMIGEKEMVYFLTTSCDLQWISGKESILPMYKGVTNKDIEEYLSHSFVIPDTEDPKEFSKEMVENVSNLSAKEFYKKYDQCKLENVFEKEWKFFIDMVLGRITTSAKEGE